MRADRADPAAAHDRLRGNGSWHQLDGRERSVRSSRSRVMGGSNEKADGGRPACVVDDEQAVSPARCRGPHPAATGTTAAVVRETRGRFECRLQREYLDLATAFQDRPQIEVNDLRVERDRWVIDQDPWGAVLHRRGRRDDPGHEGQRVTRRAQRSPRQPLASISFHDA
jgi:hypothetical protein